MIVKQNNMNLEIIKSMRKKDHNQKKKEKYVIN